jgi:2',3'-cyclic-nucleotide 2'-phosphodiesterase (5'-nucleotidase family)
MSSRLFFLSFCLSAFLSCSSPPKLINKEALPVKLTEQYKDQEDKDIKKFILPFSDSLGKTMNEVLITSAQPLTKDQPESLLGNFVADIVFKRAYEKYKQMGGDKIDMCVLNNGGLRTSLPEGNITTGKLFELMPFENEMVVLSLSGEKMQDLFNYIAATGGVPVSNIKLGIRDARAHSIKINKEEFDINKSYKVLTSDYLSTGGDKMNFFKDPLKTEVIKYRIRDALIDEMRIQGSLGKKLVVNLDGRIYHE